MEQKCVNHLEQISPSDWEKAPTSVKKLVEEMAQQIEQLLEKTNRTSLNSSLPPSSDQLGSAKKQPKPKSSKFVTKLNLKNC